MRLFFIPLIDSSQA